MNCPARQTPCIHLDDWLKTECVAVVSVLITGRDLVYTLAQEVRAQEVRLKYSTRLVGLLQQTPGC